MTDGQMLVLVFFIFFIFIPITIAGITALLLWDKENTDNHP